MSRSEKYESILYLRGRIAKAQAKQVEASDVQEIIHWNYIREVYCRRLREQLDEQKL